MKGDALRKLILVDEADRHLLERPVWLDASGYVFCTSGKRSPIRLHRLIAMPGPGLVVDHLNRNKLDNRRQNLKVCTTAENTRNQGKRSDNSSGVAGVWFDTTRQQWSSQIRVNQKRINLGRFKTLEEARAARLAAETEYWGFQPCR